MGACKKATVLLHHLMYQKKGGLEPLPMVRNALMNRPAIGLSFSAFASNDRSVSITTNTGLSAATTEARCLMSERRQLVRWKPQAVIGHHGL